MKGSTYAADKRRGFRYVSSEIQTINWCSIIKRECQVDVDSIGEDAEAPEATLAIEKVTMLPPKTDRIRLRD